MEDFEEKRPRTGSYISKMVTNVVNFGENVKKETTTLLGRNNSVGSSAYLFDPYETIQKTYGSLTHIPKPSPSHSRRPSESTNSDEENQLVVEVPEFNYSPDPTKKMNLLTVPIINIQHEQDLNLLTVDSTMPTGRMSPAGRSSGFVSGAASPTPTMTSSFEFHAQEPLPQEAFSWLRIVKIAFLVGIFVLISSIIISTAENNIGFKLITASEKNPYIFPLQVTDTLIHYYPILTINIKGAFAPTKFSNYSNNKLKIEIQKLDENGNIISLPLSKPWEVPIYSSRGIGLVPETTLSHGFNLFNIDYTPGATYNIVFQTNTAATFPFSVSGQVFSEIVNVGAILGGAVMIGLYILIIFELVNRTLAAMLAGAASIGALASLNERPTTAEMVSWLDMETLILLFSMMVIVAILCETGFFDYAAFFMYKIANGQVWPLVTGLCLFTAFVSAFLDNVTTILLMTPVTIRICEAMELNPVPVLISIVVFSNMGGAITPVGDPPNVIISNNKDVMKAGIDFATFSLHMLLGILPVLLVAYIQLRIMFRSIKSLKFSEPYEIAELRREIDVWSRAADSLSSYSKDESHVKALLLSKVVHLQNKLKSKIRMGGQTEENYKANLAELEASCKIRDWGLLIKCGAVLSAVILLFFLHSVPELNLSMGWTALLGAVLLLILADRRELEGIFNRVEWSTLIFFSALFVVMEGVSRLGLLDWIGNQTEEIILNVDEEARLTVAILLILWVSGIASAFIDNIPFTTMMIKIVTRLSERVAIPLQPLVWALALGTCLGGNGTIIGASANVVAAGVADQHGYKFTFMQYFRIGFPMMIVSLVVSTIYLLICHTWLGWNW